MRRGFTLAELAVSLAVASVLLAGLWKLTRGGSRALQLTFGRAEAAAIGEGALRGVRGSGGILQAVHRSSGVASAGAGSLELLAPGERRSYFLRGGELCLAVNGSTSTLAKNVSGLGLRYFRTLSGQVAQTNDPALVDAVEVTLQVDRRGARYGTAASARMRNR